MHCHWFGWFFWFFFLFLSPVTRVVECTKARENHLLLVSRLNYLWGIWGALLSSCDECWGWGRSGRGSWRIHHWIIHSGFSVPWYYHPVPSPMVCWASFECNAVEVTLALNLALRQERGWKRDTVARASFSGDTSLGWSCSWNREGCCMSLAVRGMSVIPASLAPPNFSLGRWPLDVQWHLPISHLVLWQLNTCVLKLYLVLKGWNHSLFSL